MLSSMMFAIVLTCVAADPKPLVDESFGPIGSKTSAEVFKFTVPKGAKRVELISFAAGEGQAADYTYHLLPGQGAEVRINGKLVISHLRKDKDGSWFKDHIRDQEYSSKGNNTYDTWMDVSAACKVGENEISYVHRSTVKHGLRVRVWKK